MPDYDVVMEYSVPSLETMAGLASSPEWAELEAEAQPKANMRIGHFVAGHQTLQFNNGGN